MVSTPPRGAARGGGSGRGSGSPYNNSDHSEGNHDVLRVDLGALADIIGCCSLEELERALRREAVEGTEVDAVAKSGVLSFIRKDVGPVSPEAPPAVRQALLSVAARTSATLDLHAPPKQLLELGGEGGLTVLSIILSNLSRAGVEKVVLVVGGPYGEMTKAHARICQAAETLELLIVDLGRDWNGFYAQSIIAGAERLDASSPFLLCTSDHLHELKLVRDMIVEPLNEQVMARIAVWKLKDMSSRHRAALPSTAVLVAVNSDNRVRALQRQAAGQIRQRDRFEGVDAGLMVLSSTVLRELAHLNTGEYFTLTRGLQNILNAGIMSAKAVFVERGKAAIGIETQQQVALAADEISDLLEEDDGALPWSLLHKIEEGGADVSTDRGDKAAERVVFRGFLVPVASDPEAIKILEEGYVPLSPRREYLWEEEQLPALRLEEEAEHIALLIPTSETDFALACTESVVGDELPGGMLQALGSLATRATVPDDIEHITVDAVAVGEELHEVELHVVVKRQLPVVAFIIMGAAAIGNAASGPMDGILQRQLPGVSSTMVSLWRFTATLVLYAPPFVARLWQDKSMLAQMTDPSIMIPNAIQAIATGTWGICIYTAFEYTSVSTVALFAATTPLLLVLWKAITGGGATAVEWLGVGIATAGSVVVSLAPSTSATIAAAEDEEAHSRAQNVIGIILALGAAVSSAVYYKIAKQIRSRIDFLLFIFVGHVVAIAFTVAYALAVLPFSVIISPVYGLLGWLHDWPMFFTQMASSTLSDVIGTLGFFVVLRYVSAIGERQLLTYILLTCP
jgi:drug/metabolite transporter (DMT)-like permease/choline kinase